MRLIKVETKRLENFYGDPPEPYAILSHTWGQPEEELSFQDMQRLDEGVDGRRAKLDGACAQALKDGFKYVWIDTCCIDKTNAVELSEAITSMFRWYKKSAMCYTYLSDVNQGGIDQIGKSRWFTRGWTLQELLASPRITFLDSKWQILGTKALLSGIITTATGIPHRILTGLTSLDSASVAQRFSWASKRTTTRPEDMAYCLFGIFDVVIPPLYGEGLEAAFERLQEAIIKRTNDDSIFAWNPMRSPGSGDSASSNKNLPALSGGILATSPVAFKKSGDIIQRPQTDTRIHASETIWRTMSISIPLHVNSHGLTYGYLSCGPKSDPSLVIAIPLVECNEESSRTQGPPVFLRPRDSRIIATPAPSGNRRPQTILVRKDRARDPVQGDDKSYWFYLPGPYPGNSNIEEVYPASSYDEDTAMIRTPTGTSPNTESTIFLVRFSRISRTPERCLLALEFYPDSAQGKREPQAILFFDGVDSPQPLSEVTRMWPSLSQSWATEIHSAHEPLSIKVQVTMERIAGHCLWAVNFSDKPLHETTSLTIPRGWPNIAEQIRLRNHGIDLFQHLREGAVLTKQYDKLFSQFRRLKKAQDSIDQELATVRTEISRLQAVAEDLEGQLSRNEEEWLAYNDATASHAVTVDKFAKAQSAFTGDRDVRRVWVSTQLPADSTTSPEPGPGWEEARRRERGGVVAHIMQHRASFDGSPKLSWVLGTTLLMYAAASGDEFLVERALSYDDDFSAKDILGRTVFDWARLSVHDASAVLALLSRRSKLEQSLGEDLKTPRLDQEDIGTALSGLISATQALDDTVRSFDNLLLLEDEQLISEQSENDIRAIDGQGPSAAAPKPRMGTTTQSEKIVASAVKAGTAESIPSPPTNDILKLQRLIKRYSHISETKPGQDNHPETHQSNPQAHRTPQGIPAKDEHITTGNARELVI